MSLLKFKNKGTRVISLVVPKRIVKTRKLISERGGEHIEKFIAATGVDERRFAVFF